MALHKNIRLLIWFNFFTDFKLYAPIAIIYFAHVSQSYALGMSVFSIIMISSALFEIPTGVFSDMIGRKRTVIYGALASVLSTIFYAVGLSYWILVIGAIFEGLSRSFYSGNNDALLYDTLAETKNEQEYSELLGKVSSMFQGAAAISAILGGILASWSFQFIMILSIIPQVLCLYIALLLVEPKIHSKKSGNIYIHLKDAYKNFLHNKKLRLLSIASVLGYGFGEASFQFQAAFYNTLWPVWAVGIAKAISNILATASFYFSGKLLKKFNGITILLIDNVFNRLVNIIATAFPTILSPLFMSSTSIFFGVGTVSKNTLMQKDFTDEQRATMGSLNSFAGSIVFGIISLFLGLIADRFSPAQAILILQIFQIGNLWLWWRLFSKHR